jgi:hypothetical protein
LNDRAAEAWEPLLAIADEARGDWPARARAAAIDLYCDEPADSVGISLLRAIRDIFAQHEGEHILSADVVRALVQREGEPWAEWWSRDVERAEAQLAAGQRPTALQGPATRLARLLHNFGVVPITVRDGEARGKGYRRADFDDPFSRYLGQKP